MILFKWYAMKPQHNIIYKITLFSSHIFISDHLQNGFYNIQPIICFLQLYTYVLYTAYTQCMYIRRQDVYIYIPLPLMLGVKLAILKQKQLLNKLFVLHKRPDIIFFQAYGVLQVVYNLIEVHTYTKDDHFCFKLCYIKLLLSS